MPVREISTLEDFHRITSNENLTVVDFYAELCGPCQAIAPTFTNLSNQFPNVNFIKVNVETAAEISQSLRVSAMPTFIFFRAGVEQDRLQGGDPQQLASKVELYASSNINSSLFNEIIVEVSQLPSDINWNVDVTATSHRNIMTRFVNCLNSETPLGVSILPFMAQGSFPPHVLENLIGFCSSSSDDAVKSIPEVIIALIIGYIIASSRQRDWEKNEGSLELHNMVKNIAESPNACKLLTDSVRFHPPWLRLGAELPQQTPLGALASISLFSPDLTQGSQLLKLMEMFPFAEHKYDENTRCNSEANIQGGMLWAETSFRTVVQRLLSHAASRHPVLRWLAAVLMLHENYRKTMHRSDEMLQRAALGTVAHTIIALALPVVSIQQKDYFPKQVPLQYLYQANPTDSKESDPVFVKYADDEEKIFSGDKAVDPPSQLVLVKEFRPKDHLFFLGIRALTVYVTPLINDQREQNMRMHHPSIQAREQALTGAMHAYSVSLLTDKSYALPMIQFADGVATWLLHILGISETGYVLMPSAEWANLPLCIVEDVFKITRLITGLEDNKPPMNVEYYEIQNIVSLMLVVMGNTDLLPKPHMHTLFPHLLYTLLEPRAPFARYFLNHPWFVSHAMQACVECYIIVEREEHEKVLCRHYLSEAMLLLLQDQQTSDSIKEKYNHPDDNTLERLCTMLTSEANHALDSCFENLGKMHQMEVENDRQPPDTAEYRQRGGRLRSDVILSRTAVRLFSCLIDHFRKGMARNMTLRQIGDALMKFVVVLAGDKSSNLKITDPAKYQFKPREMLDLIVSCFVKFSQSEKFRRYCIEGQMTMEPFYKAARTVIDRQLIAHDLCLQLEEMVVRIQELEVRMKEEEEVFDDPPPEFTCALMMDLLTDPVALPPADPDVELSTSTLEALTIVNRESIRHNLLSNPINPFNRQDLTFEEVAAFNKKPTIVSCIQKLTQRINDWKNEQRQKKSS